jgi:hypothetical protein
MSYASYSWRQQRQGASLTKQLLSVLRKLDLVEENTYLVARLQVRR